MYMCMDASSCMCMSMCVYTKKLSCLSSLAEGGLDINGEVAETKTVA